MASVQERTGFDQPAGGRQCQPAECTGHDAVGSRHAESTGGDHSDLESTRCAVRVLLETFFIPVQTCAGVCSLIGQFIFEALGSVSGLVSAAPQKTVNKQKIYIHIHIYIYV